MASGLSGARRLPVKKELLNLAALLAVNLGIFGILLLLESDRPARLQMLVILAGFFGFWSLLAYALYAISYQYALSDKSDSHSNPSSGSGLGIAALALGAFSMTTFCIQVVSIPCAILAIVFGAMSWRTAGREIGYGGMVCVVFGFALGSLTMLGLPGDHTPRNATVRESAEIHPSIKTPAEKRKPAELNPAHRTQPVF